MHLKRIKNILLILLAIAFSPSFFFFVQRRKRAVETKNPRILVIPQLGRIGDIMCATPVFRATKLAYPESHLAVLSSKKAKGIIKNNTRIDEIIDVTEYGFWGLTQKIRDERFDWSFDLTGTSTLSAFTLAGLVRNRVKLTRKNRPITEMLTDWMNDQRFLYTHRDFLPNHYLKMLEPLGIRNQSLVKEIFESSGGPSIANEFYKKHDVTKNTLVIGVSITAGNKIKEWGDEKFAELIRMVSNTFSATIVIIGAKHDEPRIHTLIQTTGLDSVFSATSFSLEDLPSLMKRFNLFIAVDTGPIYIAHTLHIPLIDILGPVDPLSQPPEDEQSILIRPAVGIEPSSFVFHTPGPASAHKKAIDSISPEIVFRAIEKLLGNRYNRS